MNEPSKSQPQCHQSLLPSPDFYRAVYDEIEEVGWENLVKAEEDLSCVTFRVLDEKERVHLLDIVLPRGYPKSRPSIAADVPYIFEVIWSEKSRLSDVVRQFREHLQKLQDFWSTMNDIDKNLRVVNPEQPSLSMSHRQISIGDDCDVLLHIHASKPNSLPECRFLGPDAIVEWMRSKWKKNCGKWTGAKPFHENLAIILERELPGHLAASSQQERQDDCGICYAQCLPFDADLGVYSGCATDYKCENPTCSKAFHTICLRDWLRSITTTRQSFDVLFGNCPYCSGPVAVKANQ